MNCSLAIVITCSCKLDVEIVTVRIVSKGFYNNAKVEILLRRQID
ncbi:MAG: hypothetical protein ACQJCO_09495 [cyanobacterium endosymbiont of Rhopalodia sterrenbergii]